MAMKEIFDMGGYGVFVWSSVLLGLATYVWNLVAPTMQRRAVIDRIAEGDEDGTEDIS